MINFSRPVTMERGHAVAQYCTPCFFPVAWGGSFVTAKVRPILSNTASKYDPSRPLFSGSNLAAMVRGIDSHSAGILQQRPIKIYENEFSLDVQIAKTILYCFPGMYLIRAGRLYPVKSFSNRRSLWGV
jgi:hypothetical protein